MGTINTMLTLDGEAGYRRAVNNIDKELRTLEAELKAVSSQFETSEKKIEKHAMEQDRLSAIIRALKDRQEVLTRAVHASNDAYQNAQKQLEALRSQHESENKQIEILKKNLESATKAYGEDSEYVKILQNSLKSLQEKEKATAKEIAATERNVQNTYNAYQRYRMQLAQTADQLHKTQQQTDEFKDSMSRSSEETKKASALLSTLSSIANAASGSMKLIVSAAGDVGRALSTIAEISANVVSTSINAMTKEFEIASEGFRTYAETFVKAAEKIGEFAYDSGSTFEESMSQVRAYSQASAEDMERLAQAAKDMGATTSKTASESADALGYMALNGYKTEQMLAALKPVVKSSEAGHMDLAMAANLASSTIKAYGLEVEQTEEMLNVMVATQNNSATSLEDLLGAYTNSAAMFKTLNVPMEESATILGVLANRGFKGTEIGNNLNSILVNLIGANKNAATAMTELGVSAWDEEGTFRGLTTVLKELGEAMNSGTAEQKSMIEAQIGGKRQFKTLEAMISGVSEEYDELYEATSHAFENNVLYSTAETMMDNVNGSVTLLKSAFESLGIAIFETFSGDLNSLIKEVAVWVSTMKEAVENGEILHAITNISRRIRWTIRDLITNLSEDLPDLLKIYNTSLIEGLRTMLYAIQNVLPEVLPELLNGFKELIVELAEMLPESADTLADAAIIYFSGIVDAINTVIPLITDNMPALLDAGLKVLQTITDGIMSNFPVLVDAVLQFAVMLADAFAENIDLILETGFFILMTLINGFVENLPHLLELAMIILTSLVNYIEENLSELVEAALQILLALANFLLENIDELIYMVPQLIEAIVKAIVDNTDLILEAAIVLIAALFNGLIAAAVAAVDILWEFPEILKGALLQEGEYENLGAEIMNGVINGIVNVAKKAGDLLSDAFANVKDAFKNFFDIHSPSRLMKKEIGLNIGAGVVEGIEDAVELDPQTLSGLQADVQKVTSGITLDNNITAGYATDGIQVAFYGPINLNNLTSDIDGFIEAIDERVRMARIGAGR